MTSKILLGVLAALVVAAIGIGVAGTGTIAEMFSSDSGHTCPLSKMTAEKSSCCEMASECSVPAETAISTDALGAATGAATSAKTCPKGKCCDEE
jgi:hypothetical protein